MASKTASKGSTPGPTTTSPSPSTATSCWPVCRRCCAAPACPRSVATPRPRLPDPPPATCGWTRSCRAPGGRPRRAPRAWLGHEAIDLTQREWVLLDLLVRHSGQVVSREDVLAAWQSEPAETGGVASNAMEVYVHRLRRKLSGSTLNIRNIRGLGYLLESAGAP